MGEISRRAQVLMSRNALILPVLALLVAGGAGHTRPSRSVNDWIADFASEDVSTRAEAVQALVALGPQAVAPLARALEDERESVRREAARTIGRIGPDAAEAIAALTEVLNEDSDETVQRAAAMALASIGAQAIDSLAEALDHEDPMVRRSAISALLSMGPMAKPALDELTKALAHGDSQVRLGAAKTLGRMGAGAASATAALGKMLETGSRLNEIWTAAGALARFGPPSIPTLSALLESEDIGVRSAVAAALAATGPEGDAILAARLTPEDIPGLVGVFECADIQMSWWVARALEIIGPAAVPAMSEVLAAGEENAQLAVLGALIRMGKTSEPAIPALIAALDDESRQVRRRAVYALLHMGSAARPAIAALVRIMNSTEDIGMCHAAIRCLGGFGPEVEFATDDLIDSFKREHFTVTRMAGKALSRIGSPALPALVNGLGHEHPEVRRGCAIALAQMETDIMPVLFAVLAGDDDLARLAATDAFGRMGPRASRAVGALETILNDEDEDGMIRAAVRSALQRITLEGKQPAAPTAATPRRFSGSALKAFPEAEGFGAYAVGGRGGRVIMVTNLNDSGPGSLRAACEAVGPRTVIFRVSGVVELEDRIEIRAPFITIAGQTAPGEGICLKNHPLHVVDTHDVIIRHLRVRKGDLTRQISSDALDVFNSWNVIIDHCSLSWGTDETVSSSGDLEVTIQWCMITESLPDGSHVEKTHGKGSLFTGDRGGISLHHNIYAHHERRCPRVGGVSEDKPGIVLDCRNNMIYNWGDMSGQSTVCPVKINYVGNYLKPGASTWPEARAFAYNPGGPLTRLFVADNHIEGYPEKDADNWRMVGYEKGGSEAEVRVDAPFDAPPVCTETSRSVYRSVLEGAGAILPARDAVDTRIVADIRGGKGAIVDSQWWVGGWPYYRQVPPPTDTDYDGMPDAWERKHGLRPNEQADNNLDADADGYTNIEEYLNATNPGTPD